MEAGERFGDYQILKRLATGGMAEVYLARKTGVGGFTKPVAMKVILPHLAANKKFIEMFLNEARLAVSLNQANIAQILDLGDWQGQYFIAMEFAHGMDIQQISTKTRKGGRLLPLPYAAKIVSQIAEGLYYAHTKTDNQGNPLEIVHRDVSPHNIILTFEGIAKLIDFGVAKARVTFQEEEQGILKGKFSYMSPEQVRGMPIDPRSDIFALGIVLWEICTGAHLFRESSELLTMEAILRKPVPKPMELRGDMPPDLEAIILKSLAKRTTDRFQTASEMQLALEGYLSRSGWNVGFPHLSEFLKKLFPKEYAETYELLEQERRRAEADHAASKARQKDQAFVPWEPYEKSGEVDIRLLDAPGPVPIPEGLPENAPKARALTPTSVPVARSRTWTPLLIAILLLLLCGAGAAIFLLLSSESEVIQPEVQAIGTLRVDSEPPDASVFINGKPYGRTPTQVTGLPLGEDLTVRLELRDFETAILPVRIRESSMTEDIKIKLKKQ